MLLTHQYSPFLFCFPSPAQQSGGIPASHRQHLWRKFVGGMDRAGRKQFPVLTGKNLLCLYTSEQSVLKNGLTCMFFLKCTEISEWCYHGWGVFYSPSSPRCDSEAPAQPASSQCEWNNIITLNNNLLLLWVLNFSNSDILKWKPEQISISSPNTTYSELLFLDKHANSCF